MNEPAFWPEGDDAPPELQELLSFAEAPRALDGAARQRSRRRVLALAALPAAAGMMFWVQNFALGALLGGAVSVGVAANSGIFSRNPPPKSAPRVVVRPPSAEAVRGKPSPDPVAAEAPLASVSRPVLPTPAASATATASATDDVAAEARLLEAARRAIATEPGRALARVERHEREFPSGALTIEREFLAIDALVRAGRHPEAEARGERLRKRMPGSLYEERLGRILGKGE
jgi:hypothetical protein